MALANLLQSIDNGAQWRIALAIVAPKAGTQKAALKATFAAAAALSSSRPSFAGAANSVLKVEALKARTRQGTREARTGTRRHRAGPTADRLIAFRRCSLLVVQVGVQIRQMYNLATFSLLLRKVLPFLLQKVLAFKGEKAYFGQTRMLVHSRWNVNRPVQFGRQLAGATKAH